MGRWTRQIVLVLVAGVAAAGCGGGDGKAKNTATTSSTTVQTTVPAATEPAVAAKPGSIEEAEQRLRSGGYTVSRLEVNPPAKKARKVGNNVLLYEYADAAAAKKGAGVIRDAVSDRPKRGALDTEGRRVYFLGQPQTITAQQRAAFKDLVDVAEGR
jgi:hypothetical protein